MSLRRSMLVTPGDNFRLLEKAAQGPADMAFIELEDGIHLARKEDARQTTLRALQDIDWQGRDRLVRVNLISSAEGRRDVEVITPGRPTALLLPKIESARDVTFASMLITEAEQNAGLPIGSVKIWAMIETAKALIEIENIVFSDSRMDGLVFGGGDLSVDLKVKRIGLGKFRRTSDYPHELMYARGRVVTAARAAGIDCMDIGSVNLADTALLRRWAEYSAQMGFTGVLVFGPRQVATINEVFSPPVEDITWAQEVVDRVEAAGRQAEKTVVVIDDEMVEGPIVRNAREILDRRDRIERRQAELQSARTQA